MINLPPHNRTVCLGVDLHGVRELCDQPVEGGSMFPYCEKHRLMIQNAPRQRMCAGAVVYDAAMRPGRVDCENPTGGDDVALCASCRVREARERKRLKEALMDRCPTCGQRTARKTEPAPPKREYNNSYNNNYPRKYTPYSGRRDDE